MSTTTTVITEPAVLRLSRVLDYLELTKPKISLLVLFTVAAGCLLGEGMSLNLVVLFNTLLGTALVASGASALNQLLERERDARMRRTENRPLPAGRLTTGEVLLFGVGLGIGGLVYLVLALPTPWAAVVAGVTFLSYVFVYTPLKSRTTLNTLIGAVPGALPPVIGWAAVRGSIEMPIVTLFLILFLWQVPHFLAIAWLYRDDYARAGLRMLPVVDRGGRMTGGTMVLYCAALLAVSLAPVVWTGAGVVYLLGATLLGGMFLTSAVGFWRHRTSGEARRVLRASLVYLPALLLLMLVDGALRTQAPWL